MIKEQFPAGDRCRKKEGDFRSLEDNLRRCDAELKGEEQKTRWPPETDDADLPEHPVGMLWILHEKLGEKRPFISFLSVNPPLRIASKALPLPASIILTNQQAFYETICSFKNKEVRHLTISLHAVFNIFLQRNANVFS